MQMPRDDSFFTRIMKTLAAAFRRRSQRKHVGTAEATLEAARSTMKRKKYCLLTTIGADGPSARVLQPFPPREDFSVWLGTSPASRKVAELRADDRATLVYQDDDRAACVSLVGRVRILESVETRRKGFMAMWWAFFPEGPEGDDFVVLCFEPQRIEVWDASRGITPEPFGLRSAQVTREAGTWVLV
jgi:general stress protein 26